MKRIAITFLFLFGFITANSQCILKRFDGITYCIETKDSCIDTNHLSSLPQFPGNINKWFSDSTKYPEQALEAKIQGTVRLTFTVEKEGYITNVKIARGDDQYLDHAASLSVISMPPWKPGIKHHHKIPASMWIAVHFEIKDWPKTQNKSTTNSTKDSLVDHWPHK